MQKQGGCYIVAGQALHCCRAGATLLPGGCYIVAGRVLHCCSMSSSSKQKSYVITFLNRGTGSHFTFWNVHGMVYTRISQLSSPCGQRELWIMEIKLRFTRLRPGFLFCYCNKSNVKGEGAFWLAARQARNQARSGCSLLCRDQEERAMAGCASAWLAFFLSCSSVFPAEETDWPTDTTDLHTPVSPVKINSRSEQPLVS